MTPADASRSDTILNVLAWHGQHNKGRRNLDALLEQSYVRYALTAMLSLLHLPMPTAISWLWASMK